MASFASGQDEPNRDFVSVHKHLKKELGQYPAILTSHLVNNPYLLYGWLRERARWTKSRTVIGYPSEQDGAILPAWDYPPCPASKISPKAI